MFSIRSRKGPEKIHDPFIVNDVDEKCEKKGNAYREEPAWVARLHDHIRLALLTSISAYLRIMHLGFPAFITESELETARQVNWYIAGKFFIGKFPPLMGILASGLARIVGYYGTEDLLYPGQPFVEFPMVALRRFSALLGVALVPFCYMTMRHMGHARSTATLAAALLAFENGIVTQSRYATPEIYVLFFGSLAICSWTLMYKHTQERQGALTVQAGFWQIITGISIGCAISSKWTGVLTMPVIWIFICTDVWNKLCEKHNNVHAMLKQFCIYILTVGILPLIIYYSIFKFHFFLLPNSGDHDLLVSSHLRYSLQGNVLEPSQQNIAYGSQIVIRHDGSVGGYLHSHHKRFTGGSTQQEVTVYPFVDINNIWTVQKKGEIWNSSQPVEFVRNGDQIRLEHFASTRKLHSHDHRPQLTNRKEHSEVTAYGDRLIQDVHDYWTVKILTDENTPNRDNNITWQALNQRFRLQHIRGCLLISHNVFYTPPEGENHQEVTCMASAGTHISPWIVESSYHQQLEDLPLATFEKISMYDMFKEVHKLMYQYAVIMYDRLQSSAPAELPVQKVSRGETPSKWFFRRASLRIWGELKGYTTHLVINPTVQSLVVLLMLNYVGLLCLNSFLTKRQIKLPSCLSWLHADSMFNEFYSRSIMLFYTATVIHVAGLNFLPVHMISMSDILGSIYYGAGLAAVMIESFTLRLSSLMRRIVIYGFIFGCIARFSGLSLLTYGRERFYREQCEKSRIDMDCVHFPRQQPVDTLDGSTRTSSPTNTVFVGLAGQVQAFSYNYGQEAEADKHIAVLKQQSFAKEAQNATGVYRFHRVSPTPAISPEEAVQWAQQVHSGAVQRAKAAKEKAAIEKEKKKSKKKNKNKPAQEVLVDGGPIMDQI